MNVNQLLSQKVPLDELVSCDARSKWFLLECTLYPAMATTKLLVECIMMQANNDLQRRNTIDRIMPKKKYTS